MYEAKKQQKRLNKRLNNIVIFKNWFSCNDDQIFTIRNPEMVFQNVDGVLNPFHKVAQRGGQARKIIHTDFGWNSNWCMTEKNVIWRMAEKISGRNLI